MELKLIMRFGQTVFKNSSYGMLAQFAIKVLSFTFSILIIRNLGAENYGQYTAVLAFGAVFMIISDLGLSPYLVREIARLRDTPGGQEKAEILFSNVVSLRLVLSLVTALITTGAAWLTGRPLIMLGAIALNSLGLFLYSFQGTSEAVLSGYEYFGLTSFAKVMSQLTFVVGGALVLFLGLGYYGLIIANIIGISVMSYLTWRGLRHRLRLRRSDFRVWPKLVRAALPFGIIGFALGLSYKFDTVLLNVFRSDTETGYYSAAYNLIFSVALLSNVVNTALYPSLTRRASQGAEGVLSIYERVLRYLLMISLPIAFGGWALADPIVRFLYSSDYGPSISGAKNDYLGSAFHVHIRVLGLYYFDPESGETSWAGNISQYELLTS